MNYPLEGCGLPLIIPKIGPQTFNPSTVLTRFWFYLTKIISVRALRYFHILSWHNTYWTHVLDRIISRYNLHVIVMFLFLLYRERIISDFERCTMKQAFQELISCFKGIPSMSLSLLPEGNHTHYFLQVPRAALWPVTCQYLRSST